MRVAVGMSGGVDSSVAALLLKKAGHDVIGLFMKNWDEQTPNGRCQSQQDFEDVVRVCTSLNIPYYRLNFVQEYWDDVFSTFVEQLQLGLTPNPDILCNQKIKFHRFLEKAFALGVDKIATGHYAKIDNCFLCKADDSLKDQTYFLHRLSKNQLESVLFPLAELSKTSIRQIAKDHQLPVHDKKDSTGICFIGKRNFKDFMQTYVPRRPGEIRTLCGKKIGSHEGSIFYTLGQRKGLGIGGPGEPWYIVKKDCHANVVYAAQGKHHPALYSDCLTAIQPHFIDKAPSFPLRCKAKIRYRQADQDCIVKKIEENKLFVVFDQPQRAITPGQAIVLYCGRQCLGGAVIEQSGPSFHDLGRSLLKEDITENNSDK